MKSAVFVILSHLSTSKRAWLASQIMLVASHFVGIFALAKLLECFYDHLVLGTHFAAYLALYLILNVFYRIGMEYIEEYFIANAETHVKTDLYEQVFSALQEKEEEIVGASQQVSSFLQNVELAAGIIANHVATFLSSLVLFILALLVICIIDIWFAVVYLLIFVISSAVHLKYFRRLSLQREKIQTGISDSNAFCTEIVSGIHTIKAFHQEQTMLTRGVCKNDTLETEQLQYEKSYLMHDVISNLLFYISEVTPIFLGLILHAMGRTDLGKIMFLVQFTQSLVGYMINFSEAWGNIRSAENILQKLSSLLTTAKQTAQNVMSTDEAMCICSKPNISMRKMSVFYGDILAASELTFDARAGEIVALVGESGAGKSSLLNALLLHVAHGGTYQLCGINADEIPIRQLRAYFSVAYQGASLLPVSVADNLSMGNKNVSEESMLKILDELSMREVVSSLPNGLQTVVGLDGTTFSGGETQRLCIARALLKDAPFILLDEPTSALDEINERAVMDLLVKEQAKGKCIIMTSHRPICLAYATRIYVLEQGRTVAERTYDGYMKSLSLSQKLVSPKQYS